MSTPSKGQVTPPELSLKYMAWDIKRLATATEQIAACLVEMKGGPKQLGPQPGSGKPNSTSDDIPF